VAVETDHAMAEDIRINGDCVAMSADRSLSLVSLLRIVCASVGLEDFLEMVTLAQLDWNESNLNWTNSNLPIRTFLNNSRLVVNL
jgi:hypothetical protein